MVWRRYGTLERWDEIYAEEGEPSQGRFSVYQNTADEPVVFGCLWAASAADRTHVNAACEPDLEGTMSFYVNLTTSGFRSRVIEVLRDTHIPDQTSSCYLLEGFTEVCLDTRGDIVYVNADGSEFEAIEVRSDDVEPFDWPYASSVDRTPTPPSTIRLASDLDFPRAFHLGEN